MKRQLQKYEEVERSLITSYRKKIWNRFLEAINEFEMIKILGKLTGAPIPASLARLADEENLHNDKIEKDAMQSYVLSRAEEEI